jgi:hypothetical protein
VPDDMMAELTQRPPGDLTICGADMPHKLMSTPDKMMSLMMKLDAGCTVVEPSDTVVVVELPAARRIRE